MSDRTRRRVLATLGGTVVVGLAGCSEDGGGGEDGSDGTETDGDIEETETGEPEETTEGMDDGMDAMANVRVAHMSPDAPNVDVYVGDGDPVLSNVAFTDVSGYLELEPGTYNVRITAAGDESTVVFDDDVEVDEADYTIVAAGELAEDGEEFAPLILEDDTSDPGGNMARARLVHVSPDAPAVDVTPESTGDAVFDDLAYREAEAIEVEANDYTLEVRGATESNDGEVVADFDVSLNGGTVYTAFAAGYLAPDDAPADEPFDLVLAQDANY